MANNVYDAQIYEDMLAFWRFPDEMFTTSPEWMERMRKVMARRAWFPVARQVGVEVSGTGQVSGVV